MIKEMLFGSIAISHTALAVVGNQEKIHQSKFPYSLYDSYFL